MGDYGSENDPAETEQPDLSDYSTSHTGRGGIESDLRGRGGRGFGNTGRGNLNHGDRPGDHPDDSNARECPN